MLRICRILEDSSTLCGSLSNCPDCKKNKKDGVFNWIPVTEQLPVEDGNILYRVIYRDPGTYDLMHGRSYFRNGDFNIPAEVVLWRPIEETETENFKKVDT